MNKSANIRHIDPDQYRQVITLLNRHFLHPLGLEIVIDDGTGGTAARAHSDGPGNARVRALEVGDDAGAPDPLSDRELEVLMGVARGLMGAEIARELCISEQTVKNHLSNARKKLGVNTSPDAVLRCLYHGLFTFEDLRAAGATWLPDDAQGSPAANSGEIRRNGDGPDSMRRCVFCDGELEGVPTEDGWVAFGGGGIHYRCADRLHDVSVAMRQAPRLAVE